MAPYPKRMTSPFEILLTVFRRIVSAETILFGFDLMYSDLWSQYTNVRKLYEEIGKLI